VQIGMSALCHKRTSPSFNDLMGPKRDYQVVDVHAGAQLGAHDARANKTGHRERVNHLFRLLRRWPSRVIRLTSVSSLSGFCTAVLAMLQLAPWFFGLLAGAIFGIIVDYLDPHSSDASVFGAVGVFAYAWLWFAQSTKSSSH